MIARSAAEAEEARPRIAGLRAGGHCADFDKGEALPQQRRGMCLRVLVEPGREPDRVRQVEPGERGCAAAAGSGWLRRGSHGRMRSAAW